MNLLPIQSASIDDTSWHALVSPSLLTQIMARVAASSEAPIIRVATIFGVSVAGAICLPEADASAELLMLVTTPQMRRRGLARSLLAEVEREAARRRVRRLTVIWSDNADGPGVAGALFAEAGWDSATLDGVAMTLEVARARAIVSMLAARLPPCPFAFVPWFQLDEGQRENLRGTLTEHPRIPPGLDPFFVESLGSSDLSFAIVTPEKQVVGWHIAGWMDIDSAWVLVSYGVPGVLGGPCFLRLWARFCDAAAQRSQDVQCGWDTHGSLVRMSRFMQRRVAAQAVTRTRWRSGRSLPAQG